MEKEWTIKQFAEYFGDDDIRDIPEGSIAGYFINQGREQTIEQAARNMIREGYADAQICSILGLTTDHVARLRKENR